MLLKLNKICVLTLTFLQCLNNLVAVKELENLNRNLAQLKDDLWSNNVTLFQKHNVDNKEKTLINNNKASEENNTTDTLHPLNIQPPKFTLKPANRTSRQLYYSPNFFFIQNYAAEDSKCTTTRGVVGVCMSLNNCVQAQQNKQKQAIFYHTEQWPAQRKYLTYFQQQPPEFCSFRDQFGRTAYGICCIEPQTPQEQEIFNEQSSQKPDTTDDSEVLEADLNSFQPEPPMYDNSDNNIDYDPIENLKQASFFNNNNNNYIRYPWPQQFLGFSGVHQWPPPVPTHPPSIASWPPPLPTHPPNHHYPTHPPLNGGVSHIHPATIGSTTRRPTTSITTARTTTTTTKNPYSGTTSNLGLPLQCGLKNAENPDQERIVGGTNASPYEFPWIAVLFKSGKQFCGGSLITKHHILTAAHCVARMTSWDVAALTAHLGDYNIRTDFEVKHVTRRIKRLVRHKGFDFSTLHNDIAILTLNEPVQFTKEIQPICLPTSTLQQSRSYSGHIATVAGWGSLRENGPQPSILQKVQIPIWTNTECAQKYGRAAPAGIISSMICAGQTAKDSCSGDSGGPLIVNEGARYIQVGIVSWGIGCGQGQYPGVYTRVTSLLPWIYKNIK